MTTTSTTTLNPLLVSLEHLSSFLSPARSDVITTSTQQVTAGVNSLIYPTREIQPPAKPQESKSASSLTIGLSIGLPVGLFCLVLIILLFIFYLGVWKKQNKSYTEGEKYANYLGEPLGSADDFMSSRIQYKISKPTDQHILTPKASVYKNYSITTSSVDIKKDVDTFLYSKPPNIYHIDSRRTSSNNLSKLANNSNIVCQTLEENEVCNNANNYTKGRWTYQSPLSKWFLRNSTYLDEGLTFPISVKTPALHLKQLKILSRIQKDYVDIGCSLKDERSPILERIDDSPCSNSKSEHEESASSSQHAAHTPMPILYGSLDAKLRATPKEDPDVPAYPGDIKALDANPKESFTKRKRKKNRKLRKHLRLITNVKPLPLTPKNNNVPTDLIVGEVYAVTEQYEAKLVDEISILKGNYVKILATHTDGWCLAEKCDKKGRIQDILDCENDGAASLNDTNYLNSYRGIIPGNCLGNVKGNAYFAF